MANPLTPRERRRLHQVVRPFGLVYRRVTARMRLRWGGLRRAGRLDTARWLAYLVAHFRRHYHAWAGDPDLATYLRIFLRRRVSPMVRLSGFVYLHIAHDLTLVVGESLQPNHRPGRRRPNPPAVDRNEQRTTYLSFNPDFEALLLESLRGGDLGLRGRIVGWLPGAGAPSRALAQWVIALRMVSWVHGEVLAGAGMPVADQKRLLRAVESAAETAAARFWMLGLPIQPPVMAMVVPPVLLVWSPWMAGVAAAGIPLALYLWWQYEARIVNYLGYRVFVAAVRSLEDRDGSRELSTFR